MEVQKCVEIFAATIAMNANSNLTVNLVKYFVVGDSNVATAVSQQQPPPQSASSASSLLQPPQSSAAVKDGYHKPNLLFTDNTNLMNRRQSLDKAGNNWGVARKLIL